MTATLDTSDTSRQTFVDEGSEFHGTFASSRPIVVSGSIQGTVTAPEVTIAPLGAIEGAIKADKLTSAGTLSGTVDAVHVLLSGNVRSDTVIRAELLDVNLQAARGRLQVSFGPRPTPAVEVAGAEAGEAGEEGVPVAAEAAPVADVLPDAEAPVADVDAGAAARDEDGGAEEQGSALPAEGTETPTSKSKAEARRERRARKKSGRG